MTDTPPPPRSVYTALFVDFDNIYLSLAEQDGNLANEFATNPDRWLAWLANELPTHYLNADGPDTRRILIRRCYLNPQSFSKYRPYFIRAAFEVIDCPPLTQRGKTSTDIHMVMDMLDALDHSTHFSEFIILSGDSDFTPVLLRLRKHARRSVVLSAGYVSPAYKASCDYLIGQDDFARDALGITEEEDEPEIALDEQSISDAIAALLPKMADRLFEVAGGPEGIAASDLPEVYKTFDTFRHGNHWLGFYSLRRLTEAIVAQRGDLRILEEDPWRVARVAEKPARPQPSSAPAQKSPQPAGPELTAEVIGYISQVVQSSPRAVSMAKLADALNQKFGPQISNTDWLNAGAFKAMLTSLDLNGLEISMVSPGYVFDPTRHTPPEAAQNVSPAEPPDDFSMRHPGLAPLARKVHQFTDMPYLLPEQYALLLQELAREINDRGYQLTRTSKTVRDRCVEKGAPVARSHVNFVLIGIGYTGYRFGKELPEEPARLGKALVQNVLNLCRAAQFNPTEEEAAQVNDWILGALPETEQA
ncbi:MAG: hypothetical protein Kow0031_41460 [Anaerolineae bacterium]